MSTAPVHADNAAQAEYWSAPAGNAGSIIKSIRIRCCARFPTC